MTHESTDPSTQTGAKGVAAPDAPPVCAAPCEDTASTAREGSTARGPAALADVTLAAWTVAASLTLATAAARACDAVRYGSELAPAPHLDASTREGAERAARVAEQLRARARRGAAGEDLVRELAALAGTIAGGVATLGACDDAGEDLGAVFGALTLAAHAVARASASRSPRGAALALLRAHGALGATLGANGLPAAVVRELRRAVGAVQDDPAGAAHCAGLDALDALERPRPWRACGCVREVLGAVRGADRRELAADLSRIAAHMHAAAAALDTLDACGEVREALHPLAACVAYALAACDPAAEVSAEGAAAEVSALAAALSGALHACLTYAADTRGTGKDTSALVAAAHGFATVAPRIVQRTRGAK